ncbi:MAG TPA: Hpt domain-containing protein [Desulfobulbaceae bacterium]|nr:Hpt domain-containing protein [Desulfobulbaceae bacterium]
MSDLLWKREFALEQTAGDEELLEELLTLFKDSSAQDYEKLCQAAASGDTEGVVAAAHSLKGASASLGIEGIRLLAQEMEAAAREGSVDCAVKKQGDMAELLSECGKL